MDLVQMLLGPKFSARKQRELDSSQRVRGKCCSGQSSRRKSRARQMQAKGYEENVVRPKGYGHFAKTHVPFGPNCHNGCLPNSSQRVRGKCCSGQRVRAFCKKSRTRWPQLPQWTFAKFKPELTGKYKFAPKLSVRTTGARNPGVPVREAS